MSVLSQPCVCSLDSQPQSYTSLPRKGLSSVLTQPLTLGVLCEISSSLNSLFSSKPVITLLAVLCENCAGFSCQHSGWVLLKEAKQCQNPWNGGMSGRALCFGGVMDLQEIGCINKAGLGKINKLGWFP